jgi:ABC-type sugar transport system, periplasmic component
MSRKETSSIITRRTMLKGATALAVTAAVGLRPWSAEAALDAAQTWVDNEFQPSTLTKDQQMEEMKFFVDAAKPYAGMDINVVSETIDTHVYETKTLAKAFREITGINLKHDIIQEGDVIEKLQTQMQSGKNVFDMYINDSDLIGTHFRYGEAIPLSDFMAGEGKDVTLPTLDVDDFIGKSFTTAPDGKLYQLPDQQFANLYWFRADWFDRADLKEKFKAKYGYDLGVPVNWSAYEDIANFFSNDVKEIDGVRVYGHMDYGKKDPSLGWRFTDAWLSMAGEADKGIPNGLPVDEWGIRVEDCHPVGASVSRGGGANSPAAVYALTKYIDWMKKYAPPEAPGMTFSEAGPVPGQAISPSRFSGTPPSRPRSPSPVFPWSMPTDAEVAHGPSPHGPYWKEGMQNGYQDCGSWTMLKSTPLERRKAAWLYAQFCVCKSTSLKKTLVGLTPIRQSDIMSQPMSDAAPKLGGLVEFYRSPARVAWTPTGTNVPDYPKLAQLWWPNVAAAVTGEKTPQAAMDNLAKEMDRVLARLERAGMKNCAPKLNPEKPDADWLSDKGAPWAKIDESPKGETVPYDQLLADWKAGKVR